MTYQKGAVGYGELVEFFYRTHDPTQVDRQGPDRGDREYPSPWAPEYHPNDALTRSQTIAVGYSTTRKSRKMLLGR